MSGGAPAGKFSCILGFGNVLWPATALAEAVGADASGDCDDPSADDIKAEKWLTKAN